MPRQISSGPHAITTTPSLIKCGRCGTAILAATVGGLDVHIDTVPLNETGELAAILGGRCTYDLNGERLSERNPERIKGVRRSPVLAEHRCGAVAPAEHIQQDWAAESQMIMMKAIGVVVVAGLTHYAPPF